MHVLFNVFFAEGANCSPLRHERVIKMNFKTSDAIIVNLLKEAVESQGCFLAEVDLENLEIKVNGPDEIVSDCARAVAEILD